jgi:hypothetical protein
VKLRLFFISLFLSVQLGCVTKVPKDYTAFFSMQPNSILVIPPMNESVEVTAPIYFLSTISMPLAERGYYVFPVNLTKGMLEEVGLSDPGLIHNSPPHKLKKLFGCDAVLYIKILKWDTQYLVIGSDVTVTMEYTLKDAATGAVLWQDKMTVAQESEGDNICAMMVDAAVTALFVDYVPLARKANRKAVNRYKRGLPAGKYHKDYGKDHAWYHVTPTGN